MDSTDSEATLEHNYRDNVPMQQVKPFDSGIGLPYAPENWPNPGDTWRWKVGPRVNGKKGYFKDRYLFPPKYLPGLTSDILRKGRAFRSRRSVERYIRLVFPEADVCKFFASFSWNVPSAVDGQARLVPDSYSSDEDVLFEVAVCKAGNENCRSLGTDVLSAMPCDICCGEPRFCGYCCCILCCKSISSEHGGYSYIECEAVVSEDNGRGICRHVAHVNCALRAYMAGTVGGSTGLDGEYYCRRCDSRKDLVPFVHKFLEICQTVEHQHDVEKILNLGVCILQGSQRDDAKELLNCIKSTLVKLKCGTSLQDVWICDSPPIWSDYSDDGADSLQDLTPIEPMSFNHQAEMHNLEEEIDEVLKELRKAQETEYQIAKGKLHAQKECLGDLYKQLGIEKSEISRNVSGSDASSSMMTNVLKRLEQIRKEDTKLKKMEEVAKGFGKTPKGILEEHFHLKVEE